MLYRVIRTNIPHHPEIWENCIIRAHESLVQVSDGYRGAFTVIGNFDSERPWPRDRNYFMSQMQLELLEEEVD